MLVRALAPLLAIAVLAGCVSSTDEDPPADPAAADGALGTGEAGAAPGNATAPPAPAPLALDVATSGVYPVNPGFSPATLTAASGAEVTVTLTNAEPLPLVPHDWVLEGVEGAATETIGAGASGSVTFVAPAAGEYVFFCSIGDHRERGMEGTFTVTA